MPLREGDARARRHLLVSHLRDEILELFEEAQHLGAKGSPLSFLYESRAPEARAWSVYRGRKSPVRLAPKWTAGGVPLITSAAAFVGAAVDDAIGIAMCSTCGRPREWRVGCNHPMFCTYCVDSRANGRRGHEARRMKRMEEST